MRILMLPPERGHSCPQQRPSGMWASTRPEPSRVWGLLRTGMSALRLAYENALESEHYCADGGCHCRLRGGAELQATLRFGPDLLQGNRAGHVERVEPSGSDCQGELVGDVQGRGFERPRTTSDRQQSGTEGRC